MPIIKEREQYLSNQWDSKTLNARIEDINKRLRYEAGSPNVEEIECYGRFMRKAFQLTRVKINRHVVMLGMTPELRNLALDMGCRVTCVDNNTESIKMFKDWVSENHRLNEQIINADWFSLKDVLDIPADAIIGDGVFGNILSMEDYRRLLRVFSNSIKSEGFIILRTIMIPRDFNLDSHKAERLLSRFRTGEINEAEFGFGMRIFGSYAEACRENFLLDNKAVFVRYEDWFNKGILSKSEYEVIQRYYFRWHNLIPPQDIWETMLTEEGFAFQQYSLKGKLWYEYYPVYYCFKADEPMDTNI